MKKNILILMADQLTPFALASYGNGPAKTPRLDALAAQSVVFESAYCASPLCAPSRFSFLSGKLPSAIGAFDNASEFPSETLTFAHYLRAEGYRTSLSGKMHFCGADQLHGFETRLTTDIYPADFGWTPDWTAPELRPSWYHNMGSVLDAGLCVRSNQLDFDDDVTFTTRRHLFDIARERQAGTDVRPFCLVASLTHPHDPYAIPQRYWDMYDDTKIPLPSGPVADDPHSRRLRHVSDVDRTPPSIDQIRRARRAYYGAVSYVDEQFGVILDALHDAGLADDTIVMVTSDHGDMLGEHGLWYKMTFLEGGCRVPLIVHAPDMFPPHRVHASVSHLDLLPTLVDLARGERVTAWPDAPDGRSLLPHLRGHVAIDGNADGNEHVDFEQVQAHDEAIGEYLGEGAIAPVLMIRRGRFKFIHTPSDPDQLYDLLSDPQEQNNLADLPEHVDRVSALRAEIARRWDLDALHHRVIASQKRRRFHFAASSEGKIASWDWQPYVDASQRYMRNHIDLDTLEASARFPAVHPPVAK